jgi:hypothetical protein
MRQNELNYTARLAQPHFAADTSSTLHGRMRFAMRTRNLARQRHCTASCRIKLAMQPNLRHDCLVQCEQAVQPRTRHESLPYHLLCVLCIVVARVEERELHE